MQRFYERERLNMTKVYRQRLLCKVETVTIEEHDVSKFNTMLTEYLNDAWEVVAIGRTSDLSLAFWAVLQRFYDEKEE